MKKALLTVSLLIIIVACSKDNIQIDPDNLLIGVWNYSDYSGNSAVYSRSNDFNDGPCYKFNSDGTMTERKNAGWCGTPPISYADYPGTWTILDDTLIQISVGYWGGTIDYKLDIESIDSKILKVTLVYEDMQVQK
jgi:hypothetical protein